MLFFNRHIRSLPSEGWICNFEVVWLYHLFHRAEFIERVVAQYGPCEYGNRQSFKCQLTSSYESECNCCWPDICQGPSPKRRPHSLLSFVAWTNWSTQVLIQHRASNDALTLVENILCSFFSRSVYSSFDKHGCITAITQAVVHVAFLRWIIHDASQLSTIDGRLFFRMVPSHDQYGLPQKHICRNRASALVSRLPNWTSHFGSIRMLGMSMQDSPFWIPVPVLKSNMPKVPRSCSNWCWGGVLEDKVQLKERVQWG